MSINYIDENNNPLVLLFHGNIFRISSAYGLSMEHYKIL